MGYAQNEDNTKAERYEEDKRAASRTMWAYMSVVAVLTVALPIFTHFSSERFFGERGTFGDQFGILAALFSGVALGLVAYTARLQSIEIHHQRIEMENATKAHEESKAALEGANVIQERHEVSRTTLEQALLFASDSPLKLAFLRGTGSLSTGIPYYWKDGRIIKESDLMARGTQNRMAREEKRMLSALFAAKCVLPVVIAPKMGKVDINHSFKTSEVLEALNAAIKLSVMSKRGLIDLGLLVAIVGRDVQFGLESLPLQVLDGLSDWEDIIGKENLDGVAVARIRDLFLHLRDELSE